MALQFDKAQADMDFAKNGPRWSFTPLDQGVLLGLGGHDREGVCAEICRRWVRRRNNLDGGWSEKALDQIVGIGDKGGKTTFPTLDPAVLKDLVDTHRATGVMRAGELQVKDMKPIGQMQRNYVLGCCGRPGFARNLSSRSSMLNAVLSPGLYIVTASKGGTGHVVAFDSRGNEIHFMDPNRGEFWIGNAAASSALFREWFTSYWGVMYKDMFNKGQRNLYQYA
jgi:hypothetical protein